jgi:hypothetical protein
MRIMKRISLSLILLIMLFYNLSCTDAKDKNDGNANSKSNQAEFDYSKISNFYGVWIVTNVERYRGGLTTEEEAKSYIQKTITISKDKYIAFISSLSNPIYKYRKINNKLPEGVVSQDKTSSFYGYKMERDIIHLYEVYDKDELYADFEAISPNELLFMFDGWFFFSSRKR